LHPDPARRAGRAVTTHVFTAADGLRLAYRDEGAGQPVLCLAGLTRNASDFDYLAPHLLPRVRLIRPDYRGRGASDRDPDPMRYSVPVEARDALALLDHLGLARAAVIGTSRGGLIAMFLAATAKARLAGVLLNDVGPVIEPAGLERIFAYLGRPPAARSHAEAAALLARTPGFSGVPPSRWLDEARHLFEETPGGLRLRSRGRSPTSGRCSTRWRGCPWRWSAAPIPNCSRRPPPPRCAAAART
jgi:pimeloyl-ACP methyl ester carboxylesterase